MSEAWACLQGMQQRIDQHSTEALNVPIRAFFVKIFPKYMKQLRKQYTAPTPR
jgi:hypothetical protein